jgi:hypothetical protein
MSEPTKFTNRDRVTIRLALLDAIDWHKSLIGAYCNSPRDYQVRLSARRIVRYKSLLREFGGEPANPFAGMESVPISEVMQGVKSKRRTSFTNRKPQCLPAGSGE